MRCSSKVVSARVHVGCLELFDLKSKYDESDNMVVRVARTVTDKVSGAFCTYANGERVSSTHDVCVCLYWLIASIFSQSEMSEALTEICRVDPTFDAVQFLRVVQYDIIPNIFEVSCKRGNFAYRSLHRPCRLVFSTR